MRRRIILIFAVLCSLQLRVNAQSVDAGDTAYASVTDDNGLLLRCNPYTSTVW